MIRPIMGGSRGTRWARYELFGTGYCHGCEEVHGTVDWTLEVPPAWIWIEARSGLVFCEAAFHERFTFFPCLACGEPVWFWRLETGFHGHPCPRCGRVHFVGRSW